MPFLNISFEFSPKVNDVRGAFKQILCPSRSISRLKFTSVDVWYSSSPIENTGRQSPIFARSKSSVSFTRSVFAPPFIASSNAFLKSSSLAMIACFLSRTYLFSSPQTVQVYFFAPSETYVGSVVITPASQVCSLVFAMVSGLVVLHLVHVKVFTPVSLQVAGFVTLPSSHA